MRDFLNHLESYQMFLGSKSPRRQSLLKQLGIPFSVWLKEEVEEDFPSELHPAEVAVFLAKKKTMPYIQDLKPETILITADTIVVKKRHILGKPADVNEAREMLAELSGTVHQVITGICLRTSDKETAFSATTEVKFSSLEKEEIDYYITHYSPFDKAGSYGIQEWIGMVGVESIKGSYFNVMGLPVHQVYQKLKQFTNYKTNAL